MATGCFLPILIHPLNQNVDFHFEYFQNAIQLFINK